jgi:hypothetical protein
VLAQMATQRWPTVVKFILIIVAIQLPVVAGELIALLSH